MFYGVQSNTMKAPLSKQQGFTIIEVMVALVLSTVALLGLAIGELKSLQYATNSFNYTVSLIQANNVIERTWDNLCDLQDGTVAFDNTYSQNFMQPQTGVYKITTLPVAGTAFTNSLNVTVNWTDARMADPNESVIRLNAMYPQICS